MNAVADEAPRTPRRRAAPPGDARERILAAAAREFSAIGYAGARVDAIAAAAGVNKAMLYYHVGGKRELYSAVLSGTIEKALASLRAALPPDGSPEEKLRAVVSVMARLGAENPVFVPIVMREVASGGKNLPDELLAKMGAVFRFVAEILAEGARRGAFRRVDPLLTHVTLVGSVMFAVVSQPVRQRVARLVGVPVPKHDPAALAEHVAALFLGGLRAAPASSRRPR